MKSGSARFAVVLEDGTLLHCTSRDGARLLARRCREAGAEARVLDRGAVAVPKAEPPAPPEPDWVVVERLVHGEKVPRATREERAEAARRLARSGYSATVSAARLRTTERTITRYRSAV